MSNKQILFKDDTHKAFYNEQILAITKSGVTVDSNIKSLMYLLSLTGDTRRNVDNLYDVNDGIKPEGMRGDWLTASNKKIIQLAFNLYNGYTKDGRVKCSQEFSPYFLFNDDLAPFFVQATKLRYPECFRTRLEND